MRREVFIDEQGVPEADELDDLDPECTHLLALPRADAPLDEAYGTARLWRTPEGKAKAQRVAVKRSARGQGVGEALMRALEDEAARQGFDEVVLCAQLSAVPFYEKLGYAAYGEQFYDAGIPHQAMRRGLTACRLSRT